MKKTKIEGYWFLPNQEEGKNFGVLRFNPRGQFTLEVYGILDPFNEFICDGDNYNIKTIHGVTSSGKKISLLDCQKLNNTFHIHNSSAASSMYLIRHALTLYHYPDKASIDIHKLVSFGHNLTEWTSKSGFKFNNNKQEIKLLYKYPEKIETIIDKNLTITLSYILQTKASHSSGILLKQNVSINLTYKNPIKLEDSLDDLLHYLDFITLLTFKPSYPLHINAFSTEAQTYPNEEDLEHPDFYESGSTIYSKISIPHYNENLIAPLMIFNYKDIQASHNNILINWFNIKNTLSEPYKILIDSIYNRGIFTENNFLNCMQALETFHRRTHSNEVIPDDQHRERINTIKKVVSKHYEENNNTDKKSTLTWLIQKIGGHSNEPTLHLRLNDLLSNLDKIIIINKIIPDKQKFITECKNSRNYYTHLDPKSKHKALSSSELYFATEKLRLILYFSILKHIGFDTETINSVIQRNEYKLSFHLTTR